MSTLNITKTYADGEVLLESDLDNIINDVETFVNVTKLNDDNLQNSGITASDKLIDGTITATKLATDAVTSTKIQNDSITTAKILDDAVTAAKLRDDPSVDGNRAVTTDHIRDLAATTAKIDNLAVTSGKIAALAVIAGKIANGAVDTTARLADGIVSNVKLGGPILNIVVADVGTVAGATNGTTLATTTLTTTSGRNVFIFLMPKYAVSTGSIPVNFNVSANGGAQLFVRKNGSNIRDLQNGGNLVTATNYTGSYFFGSFAATTGSNTYDLRFVSGGQTINFTDGYQLLVIEL